MGLDSVELLMEWEKFFELDIPDVEASKMAKISDAVTYISAHLEFIEREIDIKQEVLQDLKDSFKEFNLTFLKTDLIFEVLPINKEETWEGISKITTFEIPLVIPLNKIGNLFNKLFPNNIDYNSLDFDRYLDLIAAINYQKLIPKGKVKNQYEVMIAVMGITIEKIGVSPFEVFWNSSFTNDLGID